MTDEDPTDTETPPADDVPRDEMQASSTTSDTADRAPNSAQPPQGPPPADNQIPERNGTVAVFALGIVLVLVLGLANMAIAADRTALDDEHVIETFDDEDVYGEVTQAVQDMAVEGLIASIDQEEWEQMDQDERAAFERDMRALVEEYIDRSYVQTELNRNIRNLYAYLDGDLDEIRLATNLEEPREGIIADLPWYVDAEAVGDEIPAESNITEGGEPPSQLGTAQTGANMVGIMTWLLPLVALGLIGLVYFVTNSTHRTGNTAGAALITAGVIGLIVGFVGELVVTDMADDALTADASEVQAFFDGFVEVVNSMFGTMLAQSFYMTLAGAGAMGLVWADKEGHLEGVKASLGIGEQEPDAAEQQVQPQQGQPPAGHGQQAPPPAQQPPGTPHGQPPAGNQPQGPQQPGGQPLQGQPPQQQPPGTPPEQQPSGPQPPTDQESPPESSPTEELSDRQDGPADAEATDDEPAAEEFDEIGYPADESPAADGDETEENDS